MYKFRLSFHGQTGVLIAGPLHHGDHGHLVAVAVALAHPVPP